MKEIFTKYGIDALIVPSVDEFFGEYVPTDRNRLLKITGFSGSNGVAIITPENKNILLTDGRYTQQAKIELDNSFEIIDTAITKLSDVLTNFKRIGFLSELHSIFDIQSLAFEMVPVSCKEIDSYISVETNFTESLDSIIEIDGQKTGIDTAEIIKQLNIGDAMLISDPASVCWLLNIRGQSVNYCGLFNSYLAIFSDGSYKLFNDLYDIENVLQIFSDSKNISADFTQLNYHLYTSLKDRLFHQKNPIMPIKAIKTEQEINGMKQANLIDSKVLNRFITWLKNEISSSESIDEVGVAEELLKFRQQEKLFIDQSFATICGFAENGAIIHYHATKNTAKKIEKNNTLLLDSGAHYSTFGTSDITRTISTGGNISKNVKLDYTLVLKGHIAIATAIFPKGTTGAQIDTLARKQLWENGKDYSHGTGHGVGCYLSVHEGPCSISKKNNVILQEGMILSNEPGFYVPGSHGIRIENLILVRKHDIFEQMLCFETISFVAMEEELILYSMLTQQELIWLQKYQQKCSNL